MIRVVFEWNQIIKCDPQVWRLQNYYEKVAYFKPGKHQEFLVLIWPIMEE